MSSNIPRILLGAALLFWLQAIPSFVHSYFFWTPGTQVVTDHFVVQYLSNFLITLLFFFCLPFVWRKVSRVKALTLVIFTWLFSYSFTWFTIDKIAFSTVEILLMCLDLLALELGFLFAYRLNGQKLGR